MQGVYTAVTPEQFKMQMHRCEDTWPGKHFEAERLELIWSAVAFMDLGAFAAIVDHLIANSRYAPLPKDFIEAARVERAKLFKRDVMGASKTVDTADWSNDGLKKTLAADYPGCKTLSEAIEVAKLKLQIKRANGGTD